MALFGGVNNFVAIPSGLFGKFLDIADVRWKECSQLGKRKLEYEYEYS